MNKTVNSIHQSKAFRKENKQFVLSYLEMRKAIGLLGIALPIVLLVGNSIAVGCIDVKTSISAYYYTAMRNLFVGIMFAVGFFLFAYHGLKQIENILSYIGSVFAVIVAFFPCSPDPGFQCSYKAYDAVHLIAAILFFAVLIIFSIFVFTARDDPNSEVTKGKKRRNRLFITCGFIMLGSLCLIPVFDGIKGASRFKPEFYLESIALIAFGISWLVKGSKLWKNKK